MATTFLNMSTWSANQNSPWTTLNTALNTLDGAVAGQSTVNMGGDANYTLLNTGTAPYEWQTKYLIVTNTTTMTAARDVYLPSAASGTGLILMVKNSTGDTFAINFGLSGNTLVTIEDGTMDLIFFDGTNAFKLIDNVT